VDTADQAVVDLGGVPRGSVAHRTDRDRRNASIVNEDTSATERARSFRRDDIHALNPHVIGGNREKPSEQQAAHRNDQPVLRCVRTRYVVDRACSMLLSCRSRGDRQCMGLAISHWERSRR
jgi:hypothetical protein